MVRYPQPQRYHEQDPVIRVMKGIKVDAPSFDGRLDPKVFSDWLADMDHFFQWHGLPDPQRVGFAKMKLVGQAKLHWGNVERRRE